MNSTPSKAEPISFRKLGMPAWMTQRLDKLHVSTDLEKYGSSPPTSDTDFFWDVEKKKESFIVTPSLTESRGHSTDLLAKDNLQLSSSKVQHMVNISKEPPKLVPSMSAPVLKVPTVEEKLNHSQSSTSAESTPNVTPCSSPLIFRKVKESGLQANPELSSDQNWNPKWLSCTFNSHGKNTASYSSNLSPVKEALDGSILPKKDTSQVENPVCDMHIHKIPASSLKKKKISFSNSDINIVSPSSW
ncbi:uncharacterized protein LOC106473317 [Limulus polyphemus]|uniref:Uncharacterized protein LOC106473317 n=1 Tax=Limulus polyphemus TaxID=6850 RepID=A0ABM1BVG5_LIMPO|nr:uncharacterized protein LOC106473317 [Limulus polyphemus]XP_022257484.1 uncharacterized protein LOC106473317 [Limulus polyphemus]